MHDGNMPRQAPAGLASFLAPIQEYLDRPDVIELCINRPQELFVETYDGWKVEQIAALTFDHLKSLATTAATFTKQSIDATRPILSGSLPGGERIQIVIPPAVPQGTVSITIRKPAERTFSLEDYEDMGMFEDILTETNSLSDVDRKLLDLHAKQSWKAFLKCAVRNKKNILVSGSTGSGKTTFSKALIPEIPENERLLTIEDTVELVIPQRNNVRLIYSKDGQGQAKLSARQLLESSLRMRPDRIFLQELRDAEAFYYLRNVNTGHSGSITTIHADSAMLAFEQLALLVKESEAGRDLKRSEIKEMLFQMVDVVVQVKRSDGRFRISEIFFDPTRKFEGAKHDT
ncbi:type IV secretion system protein VirB11 [Epibacterium ulvae]|uniref:Type IV secretion system protein n=1 Tax=Epibacterium ulvae TaxID=1156985 RepID=A0A1G5RHC3_9RHOB|nr:P-type DNA transfer ATPase VirB11 [Epibacterium ulvae]SCZ73495.1 type IV secretion system protein VirB11 [Epibacterium ulvae]